MFTWKEDEELNQDLEEYVRQEMKRDEILNFVFKKYLLYAWSLRTLCHCLYYFEDIIKCMNYEIEVDDLEESVREEMNGPENFKQ